MQSNTSIALLLCVFNSFKVMLMFYATKVNAFVRKFVPVLTMGENKNISNKRQGLNIAFILPSHLSAIVDQGPLSNTSIGVTNR